MADCRTPGSVCGTLDHPDDRGTTNKQQPNAPGPVRHPPPVSGCTPTVKIDRVIRGNPHVESDAKAAGLPDSLPPGKKYRIKITVNPPLDSDRCAAGQFIELGIAGGGGDAGTARITPSRITKTTTVTVQGDEQTKADFGEKARFAAKLKIQARLNGKQLLAESHGFTVCAHPLNWHEAFDSNIDETLQQKHVVGMYVKISCDSDSGDVNDLKGAQVKELLDFSARPKEPPFHDHPFDTSDYQLAVALGNDRHTILFPDDRPDAAWKIPQLSVYRCLRCGCSDVALPSSGMIIIFHVKNRRFFVEKVPASVTVQGKSSKPADLKEVKSREIAL